MRTNTVRRVEDALVSGRSLTRGQIANWFGAKNPTRVIHYIRSKGITINTFRVSRNSKLRYEYAYAF